MNHPSSIPKDILRTVAAGEEGLLIALIGAHGAGKSTEALSLATTQDAVLLSLEDIRADLSASVDNSNSTPAAKALEALHDQLRSHLAAGRTVVVDAPNASRDEREPLLRIAHEHRASTLAVVIAPELHTVLHRNAQRSRSTNGLTRRATRALVTDQHTTIMEDLPRLPADGWHGVAVFR